VVEVEVFSGFARCLGAQVLAAAPVVGGDDNADQDAALWGLWAWTSSVASPARPGRSQALRGVSCKPSVGSVPRPAGVTFQPAGYGSRSARSDDFVINRPPMFWAAIYKARRAICGPRMPDAAT
jgi:hypothetical protein